MTAPPPPPPPAAPKFKIVSATMPSSVRQDQRATLSFTVQNVGNAKGVPKITVKNSSESPGYITLFDVTDAKLADINPGASYSFDMLFYLPMEGYLYPWPYELGPGESGSGSVSIAFSTTGSFKIEFSVGHDTTIDDTTTLGCPEGEDALAAALRYASM